MSETKKIYHFSPFLQQIRECHAKNPASCPFCNSPHFEDLTKAKVYLNEMHDSLAALKKFNFLDNDHMHKDKGYYGDGGRLGNAEIHSYKTIWYYNKDNPASKLQCEVALQAAGLTVREAGSFLDDYDSFVIVKKDDVEIGNAKIKTILDAQQNIPELKMYFATNTTAPIQEKFERVVEYYRKLNTPEYIEEYKKFNHDRPPLRRMFERTGYFPSPSTKKMTENYIIGMNLVDKKIDNGMRNLYYTYEQDFRKDKK